MTWQQEMRSSEAYDLMNHERNELRTYWKQFKYLQIKRARKLSSSQRQNIYISLELKLPESLGGKWMKVHHLQRRGRGSETKRNPVIKLELLEVVPQTSDDPQGAFSRDHLLPSPWAWASLSSAPWVPGRPPSVSPFPYPCSWESKRMAPGRRIFPTTPGSLSTPVWIRSHQRVLSIILSIMAGLFS